MPDTTKTYLDIAQHCVEKAVRLGAEWCDVSAGQARDISVSIEKTGIKTADAGQGEDVAVRVYVRGGMGFAVASGRNPADIDEVVERAVALAKEATPDPDFKSLPSPQPAPEVEGLFDDRVAGMSVQQVVAVAVANIERARAIDPSVNLSGHVGLSVDMGALASSTGILLEARGTEIGAGIEALVKRGSDTGYFYDFDFGRFLEDTALDALADKAIDGARRFLGARRVASGRMALVLGPLAAVRVPRIARRGRQRREHPARPQLPLRQGGRGHRQHAPVDHRRRPDPARQPQRRRTTAKAPATGPSRSSTAGGSSASSTTPTPPARPAPRAPATAPSRAASRRRTSGRPWAAAPPPKSSRTSRKASTWRAARSGPMPPAATSRPASISGSTSRTARSSSRSRAR